MAVYDFFLSRNNGPTGSNYVGQSGRLFYDSTDGLFRLSDGITPGGRVVANLSVATSQSTPPPNPLVGELWYNPINNELLAYYDNDWLSTINVATETKIGGIKLGPGITTNAEDQIIIDSTGLDFSFGDFEAIIGTYSDSTEYALLSSRKTNQDIVIASNGTGGIKLVGEFRVYRTNGTVTGSLEAEPPFFRVKDDGQIQILVPAEDPIEGGVEIIGSSTGTFVSPGSPGAMLHLTGNPEVPCRLYQDSLRAYSSLIGRRYNGTTSSPTQVLANEDVFRINATAATDAGMGNIALAQISFTALENQTTTAQGSSITLTVTPIGQPATNRVDVASITVADGVSATKFTGPLIGNADTATTATNLPNATNILTGSLNVDPAIITRSTASVQTFTISGLTTNHKIVIISGTAFGYGVFISAAWASAANTVSIEFQNFLGNTDVNLPVKNIQYFAWI
jgi:hypothetical protein